VVEFQAEVVSMRSGRILARIDEMRGPPTPKNARRTIKAVDYVAVKAKGYTEYLGRDPYGGDYEYVESYREANVECRNALVEYEALMAEIRRDFG
jgi:hypothetical protein